MSHDSERYVWSYARTTSLGGAVWLGRGRKHGVDSKVRIRQGLLGEAHPHLPYRQPSDHHALGRARRPRSPSPARRDRPGPPWVATVPPHPPPPLVSRPPR